MALDTPACYEQSLLTLEDALCMTNTAPSDEDTHPELMINMYRESISLSTANESSCPSDDNCQRMKDVDDASRNTPPAPTGGKRLFKPNAAEHEARITKTGPPPKKPTDGRTQTPPNKAQKGPMKLHWPPKNGRSDSTRYRFQSHAPIGSSSSPSSGHTTPIVKHPPSALTRIHGAQIWSSSRPAGPSNASSALTRTVGAPTRTLSRPAGPSSAPSRRLPALPQIRKVLGKALKKKHKCPECGKLFKRAHNLKIHNRLHTGEEPFLCRVPGCGKTFRWKSSIVSHTKWHNKASGRTPISTPSKNKRTPIRRIITRPSPITPPPLRIVAAPGSAASTASASVAADSVCSDMPPLEAFGALTVGDTSGRTEFQSPSALVNVGDIGHLTPIFPGFGGYDSSAPTAYSCGFSRREELPGLLRRDEDMNRMDDADDDRAFREAPGLLRRGVPPLGARMPGEGLDDDEEMRGDPFPYLDSDP